MKNEERAMKLAKSLTRIVFTDYCNQNAVALILAFADEIRRECMERAVAWAKRYDGDDGYEVTIDKLSAAIMGKE